MLNFDEIHQRMEKIVDIFAEDIASIRTGRATPGLIEKVTVTVYNGQKMKLVELGSISVADARTLTFQPWDESIIREISNGIMAANIGLTPAINGPVIHLTLPLMTVEQRDDYLKLLGRKLEGARVMMRDARADYRKKLIEAKNEKIISEDEFKRDEMELQKITDDYIGKLENLAGKKELEIRG